MRGGGATCGVSVGFMMESVGCWSRRQESNLNPTLRRHVHYPLCYGEPSQYIQRVT